MRYIIIGVSAAGVAAAREIRKKDLTCDITMLCMEDAVHSRCMLHHMVGGLKTREQLNFVEKDFFRENRIDFRPESVVSKIDREAKQIELVTGGKTTYDKLLIATGAYAALPPIPGLADGSNLALFRNLSDADEIVKLVKAHPNGKCVVIGSGLVGLDVASGLSHRGIKCSVIEMADRICPLQLDYTAASEYQRRFEEHGASFYLNDGVTGTVKDGDKITAVTLKSGGQVECDFVVAAAGVRPNIVLAQGCGLETARGIVVDELLRTTDEHIYAAGDVTAIAGIWSEAVLQGEIAARHMMGDSVEYTDSYAFKSTMNFFDLLTLSVGIDTSAEDRDGQKVVTRESKNCYQKYVLQDDVLTFALSQGNIANQGFLQQLIRNKVSLSGIDKNVFDLSYADFYRYEQQDGIYTWQYKDTTEGA